MNISHKASVCITLFVLCDEKDLLGILQLILSKKKCKFYRVKTMRLDNMQKYQETPKGMALF